MKKTQVLVPVAVIVIAIIIAWGISGFQPEAKKETKKPRQVVVDVLQVRSDDTTLMVSSQGTVEPATETSLVSEVSGVIKNISPAFVAGGVFKAGDVLFTIDPVNYEVELQQAEASLATSEARFAEEQARSQAEKTTWIRSGRPIAKAPPLLLRQPYVDEAKAGVKAAGAALTKARLYLSKTEVKAPYDGMVKSRAANLGQYIKAGEALGVIFSTDYVEVRLPVTGNSLGLLDLKNYGVGRFSMPVRLSAKIAGQNLGWDSEIVRTEGVVDERNRMYMLIARVTDPYGLKKNVPESLSANAGEKSVMADATASPEDQSQGIYPLLVGTFVQAKIKGRRLSDVIAIPRNLLRRNDEVLIEDNGVMKMRPVNILYSSEKIAYISQGLKPGDKLILTAISDPADGQAVKVAGIKNDLSQVEM